MNFTVLVDEKMDEFAEQTVQAVKNAISGFAKVRCVPFSFSNLEKLGRNDVAFNLAIGKRHDFTQGLIAAILEHKGVPFVGPSAYTHYVCLDKFTAKSVLNASSIPTPPGAVYDGKEVLGNIPSPPLMVKPIAEGSGIGVDESSLCIDKNEALKVAREKYEFFKENIIIEKYLDGVEITVGVVGNDGNAEVLPPLEIDFSHLPQGVEKYYSKKVKEEYAKQTIYSCPPAHLNSDTIESVKNIALKAFKVLKARDFIRMDMRVVNGIPYVIEVNSRPGLHPVMSDIPKMVKALSKNYTWLIKSICKRALREAGGEAWKKKD